MKHSYPFIIVLLLVPCISNGYELATHGHITQQAHIRSLLTTDSELLSNLGIKDIDQSEPFGTQYYDVSYSKVEIRSAKDFPTKNGRMPKNSDSLSIQGWLMRGAIREDDVLYSFSDNPNPQDDPFNTNDLIKDNRPLHHFYDPISDKGLSVPIFFGIINFEATKAPDWATGAQDAFTQPNVPNDYRRNHFTVFDAREAMYRALTGLSKNGAIVAATEADRNRYWATTFRALGDVIHLIQDMAQPQHTRNDPHSGKKYDGPDERIQGHKSVYELYIDARAKGEGFRLPVPLPSGTTSIQTQPLSYGGYPIPEFDDYASFFSTRHLDGTDPVQRRGLADYSNRGFFSAGTNINSSGNNYIYPNIDPSVYTRRELYKDWQGNDLAGGGKVELLSDKVEDTNEGSTALSVALTTYGLFDQFLQQNTGSNNYSLNKYNYDEMADLLIPRAVSYSAGLINYFFRGKVDFEVENYTGSMVKLKFKNLSESETLYNQAGATKLVVAYRYKSGEDWVYGVSNAQVNMATGDDLLPDSFSTQSYTFNFSPSIPSGAAALELRLVVRGKLGQEDDAIAIGLKAMTSPGFLLTPSELPADGIAGTRHIYKEDGVWKLSTDSGFVFGNVDWKGHAYGDVLSFDGPQSRYFFPISIRGYTTNIFRKGALLAQAPVGRVLGVGIREIAGVRHLAVAVHWSVFLRVYSRVFSESYANNDLYDEVTNPDGWKLIYSEDLNGLSPSTPMFFSSSGNEAQGIFGTDTDRYANRIKLEIIGETISRTNVSAIGTYNHNRISSSDYTPTFTVGPGVDNGDCTASDECLSYGTCGSITEEICLYTATTFKRQRNTNTRQWRSTITPAVISVDYIGDREVLGEVLHDKFERNWDNNFTTTRTSSASVVKDASCNITNTGSWQLSDVRNIKTYSNQELHFEGGELYIPLSRSATSNNETITYTAFPFSVNNTQDRILWTKNLESKINYLDLRHDIAVFSKNEDNRDVTENGSGVDTTSTQVNSNRLIYQSVAIVKNDRNLLYELVVPTNSTNPTSYVGFYDESGTCPVGSNSNDTTSAIYTDTGTLGWDYIHTTVQSSPVYQGFAVDQAGHVLGSQTIWAEQADGSYTNTGIWNYLTDGDLNSLIGVSGSNVQFWNLGLY